jgi:hypothetical protein
MDTRGVSGGAVERALFALSHLYNHVDSFLRAECNTVSFQTLKNEFIFLNLVPQVRPQPPLYLTHRHPFALSVLHYLVLINLSQAEIA